MTVHSPQLDGAAGPADRSFAALGSLIARHRGPMILATALRIAAAALPALHPYFLAQLALSLDEPDRALRFVVLLFVTGAVHSALWSGCDYYVAARINPLTYEFKRMAFDTVWAEDYQRFVDRPSGKVASYVNDLRTHTQYLWDSAHYGFLPVLAQLPVYGYLLWQTAASSALVYLVFLAATGVVLVAVVKPLNNRQRHLTNTTATHNGRVIDSYTNFVNVFSFRAQGRERARNRAQLDDLVVDDIAKGYALSSYWAIASFMVRILLWAAVMAFSWFQYDRGAITFAALVVSITVLLDFTNQYWMVVHHFGVWIDTSAAYREAYTYLFPGRNIVEDPMADPVDGPPLILERELEVRDLRFAYPDEPDRLVLDGVSFRVGRGEKLGVVGRSGEGKSTLIKILLGFYTPTGGQVLIDGRPMGPDDLNRLQSYVPQDTSLFQETVAYNIGYAASGVDDGTAGASVGDLAGPSPASVREAAARAHIDDFIDSLPEGYRTLVGERGIKLSLGQRQRIAIARAFLKDADLLILDEATSALDSETEARIQAALADLWTDKAAIVVAHRLATLNDVDRIIVLERGRVVESGTKAELLAAPGRFADLWGLQKSGLS